MIYTLILIAINLFSNTNCKNIQQNTENSVEEGISKQEIQYNFKIPECYSTQEELNNLV